VRHKKGSPADIYVFLEKDIEDFFAGKEGHRGGRAGGKEKEDAAADLLKALLRVKNDVKAEDAVSAAREIGIGSATVYKAKRGLKLSAWREDNGGGKAHWFFAEPVASAARITTPTTRTVDNLEPKSGPGRPKGSIDKKAADRNKRMQKAWADGEYPSIAELGRAFHVSRSHASEIVNSK
jgi:hypothetical protein